jgi:hypothetical protein
VTLEEIRETFEDAGVIATQASLEGMLDDYAGCREAKAECENRMGQMSPMFKKWLDENPDEDLHDGEHGWRGYLQERRGATPYDLVAIRKNDPLLFQRLLDTGCLMVNAKAVIAQGAQVAGISKYAGPRPVTYSLQVDKTRR